MNLFDEPIEALGLDEPAPAPRPVEGMKVNDARYLAWHRGLSAGAAGLSFDHSFRTAVTLPVYLAYAEGHRIGCLFNVPPSGKPRRWRGGAG